MRHGGEEGRKRGEGMWTVGEGRGQYRTGKERIGKVRHGREQRGGAEEERREGKERRGEYYFHRLTREKEVFIYL